ncbi:decarboxylase [Curtobacterium sp. MCBD17_034]|uniref:DeoR/GlpR family DNA-binding transcription regulator n=1 Tax=unclassified Curtobacterium TaxID=257496 RepID=UPI000DAA4209|nr:MULTISPECIES: DeoR/GlpR family DNA-binding transcription regulator [unclassified Curtobacterium]PZF58459.1 decarboxylase [Curtobacterium sp. MCBD17_034]PZM34448.1 decarboxylase [Curtobacterium sp. MCBD17_031]
MKSGSGSGSVRGGASKEQRHGAILEVLRRDGRLDVAALGALLSVTEMTVRRDLDELAAEGLVKRVRGGATLPVGSGYEPPFAARAKTNVEVKRAIAARVAGLVADGDTVLLDGGSTGLAVAEALADRVVTVCPLSLRIAAQLASSPTVRLRMPGGAVRHGEQSFIGPDTLDYLGLHRFDHFVMTASAVSFEAGFMEWDPDDAAVKRKGCAVSDAVIAAADSSKFGRTGFAVIGPVDVADTVVTDDRLGREDRNRLAQAGPVVELVAAAAAG